jgi:hypothetical protein
MAKVPPYRYTDLTSRSGVIATSGTKGCWRRRQDDIVHPLPPHRAPVRGQALSDARMIRAAPPVGVIRL